MLITTIIAAARHLLAERRTRRTALLTLVSLHRDEELFLQDAFDAASSSLAARRFH